MWMGSDGSRCAGSGVMRYLDLQGQLVLACERESSAMDKEILDADPLSHAHSWSESEVGTPKSRQILLDVKHARSIVSPAMCDSYLNLNSYNISCLML